MESSTTHTFDETARRDDARGWRAGDAVRRVARSPTFLLIPLVYAAVGTAWIVGSDWVVAHYVEQPGSQTVKGLAYVAVTTALLIALMSAWRARLLDALARSSALKAAIAGSADSVVVIDGAGDVVYRNTAFEETFGITADDRARMLADVDWRNLRSVVELRGEWQGELDLRMATGDVVRASATLHRVDRDAGEGHLFTLVCRRSHAGAQQQTIDHLTELPGRGAFRQQCSEALRAGGEFTLLLADVHRLADINQSLGSDAGDAVLCEVARRLSRARSRARAL